MQTKDYSISLDMMRTLPFRPFEVVEGDTGNVLHVTLLNNGDPMDLTDCKICVIFASSAGFSMQDETSGVTKTAESGAFDVALLPAAYGAGNVSADVQVYSGVSDETLITSARFDFRCRKSLVSGEIIRANAAYPPLVEAARAANEAAAAALAAADRIGADIGELNVQADWAQTDTGDDSFIRNKPAIPATPAAVGAAPASHAAQHGPGGADPVTPTLHASRHAAGGADAIVPASIGAAALENGVVKAAQAKALMEFLSASFTLQASHAEKTLFMWSSNIVVTLPAGSAIENGTAFTIVRWGTQTVSFSAGSGVTIHAANGVTAISVQFASALAVKINDAEWWLVCG